MAIYSPTNIKISKFDINGNNNTSNLEQLLYFTLKYSDINSIQYNIIDRKEYSDYFLFTIQTDPYLQSSNIDTLASSSDNNILNYFTSASYPTNQTSSILKYDTILNNSLGYLNTSSGQFILGNTPNIPITLVLTASLYSVNGTLGTQLRVYTRTSDSSSLRGVSGFSSTAPTTIPPLGSATLYLSGSFTPIKGERYVIGISDDSETFEITSSNVRFLITQSTQHNVGVSGSGDLLILITPGEDSENPLLNNAGNIISNPNYLTLDYTEYKLPDTEFQLVLSGSGTNSNVKQYNYEANRITIPRYRGSKSTSPDWNSNTTEGGLGFLPNVERTTPYFLYFNNFTDTSPTLKDKTGVEIKYLIDENGEVYNLNTQDTTYYTLINSFEPGKKAYATFLSNETTIYNDPQEIYMSGESYKPILYSISSSSPLIWTDRIDFLNQDLSSGSAVPNFNSSVSPAGELILDFLPYGTYSLTYYAGSFTTSTGYQTQGNWLTPGGGNATIGTDNIAKFKFTTTPESPVNFNIKGQIVLGGISFNFPIFDTFNYQIVIKKNGVTVFSSPFIQYQQNGTFDYDVNYQYTPSLNDEIEFLITVGGIGTYNRKSTTPTITISTSNLIIAAATSPFWTTGSANSNVLTSSQAIAQAYNQYIQKPISSSGFEISRDIFNIKKDDEFRFEYQESPNTFIVRNIVQGTSGSSNQYPALYVTLDKNIPNIPSLNIDHFTIRRRSIDVGTGVILNQQYQAGINGGFLIPEFPTQKLKDNLPSIVKKLTGEGLI